MVRTSGSAVVLVSCYELGHEPLGLVVPAAVLRHSGIQPQLVDLAVQRFDERDFRDARLVAISTPMHTALRLGMRAAARIRLLAPRAHICFYGLYAGLNRRHLLESLADSCLGAEFEAPLAELARLVVSSAGDPRSMRAPDPTDTHGRSPGRAIDQLPARDLITHREHYARLAMGGEKYEVGYTTTTRGCRHLCTHCPLPPAYHGSFYALPVDAVLEDIAALVARGARHITFADADFLNGPGQALRVARAMAARFDGVTFDYTAKIEHLRKHERVVDELQNLGCVFVVTALESLNDDVLVHLAKGHTRSDALAVIRRSRAHGLTLRPSLVPFTPWETRASLATLLDVIDGEALVGNVDPVQYSIRLLLPEGSLLLGDPTMMARVDGFDAAIPGYRWRHPDPGMDALQRDIARIAENAAESGAPPQATFGRIRDCITPGAGAVVTHAVGPAPRLTEDWFC